MSYTVKELRAILEEADEDAIVLLSRDPEGNGYSPWHSWSSGRYDEAEWQFYGKADLDDLGQRAFKMPRVICLWPER